MALMYFIEDTGTNNKLYIQMDTIPANRSKTYIIKKEDGYTPDSSIFDLYDDFRDELDTDKWDDSDAGSYSVSDGLNMWGDWDGLWSNCCDGSCYYKGIKSKIELNFPQRVIFKFKQDPYTAASGCGKTGVTISIENTIQVATSTDTDNNKGITLRINDNSYDNLGTKAFPDAVDRIECNFISENTLIQPSWTDSISKDDAYNNDSGSLIISGDTDDDSVTDILYHIIAYKHTEGLSTNVSQVDDNTYQLVVTNNTDSDISGAIVDLDLGNFISDTEQSLNIYNIDTLVLFKNNSDGKIYYWDGSEFQYLKDSEADVTTDDFDNYGQLTPVEISKSQLESLNTDLGILLKKVNVPLKGVVQGTPTKKLFIQKTPISTADWDQINSVTFDILNGGNIRFLVTDTVEKNIWKAYDTSNNEWVTKINGTIDESSTEDVYNYGNSPDDLPNIDFNGLSYIGFAIVVTENARLNKILFNVDIKSYFKEVTAEQDIKMSNNNLTITFSSTGHFKIIYYKG